MWLMLANKRQSRYGALKLLDFAATRYAGRALLSRVMLRVAERPRLWDLEPSLLLLGAAQHPPCGKLVGGGGLAHAHAVALMLSQHGTAMLTPTLAHSPS